MSLGRSLIREFGFLATPSILHKTLTNAAIMRSLVLSSSATRVALLAAVASVASAQNSGLKALVSKGCYSSAGGLTNLGSYQFQTPGYCQQQCVNAGKAVMATSNGSDCYCGDQLPADSDKTTDANCNAKCNGYGQMMCMSICVYTCSL